MQHHTVRLGLAALALSLSLTPALASGQAPSLRSLASARGLLLGGAISGELFNTDNPDEAATVNREYNAVVAENAIKMRAIANSPDPGNYLFATADAMVASAQKNGQTVRGHTLVWHDSAPAWVYEIKEKAAMRAAMTQYITTVVKHFGDRINVWDVVNEAISDGPGNPLRNNNPFTVAGPDFIALAFRTAHAANPAARLYYNDYNVEGLNGKSDAMYALVIGLLADGVPIDGVGFQGHIDINFSVKDSGMQANLQRSVPDNLSSGGAERRKRVTQEAKVGFGLWAIPSQRSRQIL
ncbi:endo-1,4-beta-xylanase, partial [Deinococcus marmoris]